MCTRIYMLLSCVGLIGLHMVTPSCDFASTEEMIVVSVYCLICKSEGKLVRAYGYLGVLSRQLALLKAT